MRRPLVVVPCVAWASQLIVAVPRLPVLVRVHSVSLVLVSDASAFLSCMFARGAASKELSWNDSSSAHPAPSPTISADERRTRMEPLIAEHNGTAVNLDGVAN